MTYPAPFLCAAALLALLSGCTASAGSESGQDSPQDDAASDVAAVESPDAASNTDAGSGELDEVDDGGEIEATPVEPLPDPSAPGPWPIGTVTFDLYDEARERDVPVRIWYPATPKGDEDPAEYLLGLIVSERALVDAPPAAGPWPLVLFSHGFNGIKEQSMSFTEHLASHGFVVAGMDHVGNTLFDANAGDDVVAQVALARPHDVVYVHDVLAEDAGETWPVAATIDFERVAVTGHSFGAYTALVVAGGTSEASIAAAACDAGDPSDIFCPYVAYWPPDELIGVTPPAGLRAAVSLAPGGASAFGGTGLQKVVVPTLVLGGSRDETTPLDIETRRIYDELPAPRARAEITGATHFGFTDICSIEGMGDALPELCGDPEALAHTEVFRITNHLSVAWLRWYLLDDARALPHLGPEGAAADPLLELTTDGVPAPR